MSRGIKRVSTLDPTELIEHIEEILTSKGKLEEIVIRRFISALYFAIFNFWAAKHFSKNNRGEGPNQDNFDLSEFHKEILSVGLDPEVVTLFQYRVAVDHYVMNPANIHIFNPEIMQMLGRRKTKLKIDLLALRRVLESSKTIVSYVLQK